MGALLLLGRSAVCFLSNAPVCVAEGMKMRGMKSETNGAAKAAKVVSEPPQVRPEVT